MTRFTVSGGYIDITEDGEGLQIRGTNEYGTHVGSLTIQPSSSNVVSVSLTRVAPDPEPTPESEPHRGKVGKHVDHWDVSCEVRGCPWGAVNVLTEERADELAAEHAAEERW